jgi:hypothetical protein
MLILNRIVASMGMNRLLLGVFSLYSIITVLSYLYTFQLNQTVIMVPIQPQPVPEAPIVKEFCHAVCVKDAKGRLIQVVDVAVPESLPLPLCSHAEPNLDMKTYAEWKEQGYCVTVCAKDEIGNLSQVNGTGSPEPQCRRNNLDFKFEGSTHPTFVFTNHCSTQICF